MSEAENPADDLLTAVVNGAGFENSGNESATEKIDGKESGNENKADEDVQITDATIMKVAEQDNKGNGGEMKCVNGKDEDQEMLENNDPLQATAEENNRVANEMNKKEHEKTEETDGKNNRTGGKSEEDCKEKYQGFKEKGEETEEKGEGTEEKVGETEEKVEETEEKDEESEHKDEEAEEMHEESEHKDEKAVEKGEKSGDKCEETEEKGEEVDGERIKEKDDEGSNKRKRGRRVGKKGEGKGKQVSRKTKELLRSPTPSSVERPVRERRTVERLVEVVEKEPNQAFVVEKGQGTPLKDIPNVAYKLSKKRPADVKSLHQLLFGRKGKAVNFKSHIFQFSGFVWHENEDKQRAKIKEKLDKCVKDKLLDLCDVFDIPFSRATSRKEDLVGKLLDFMVAPHATTDVLLAEKEQYTKSRKRKRMSGGRKGALEKKSRKQTKGEKILKSEKSTIDTDDEDRDGDTGEEYAVNGLSDKDVSTEHSDSDESDHVNAERGSKYSHNGGSESKKSLKKQSFAMTETKRVFSSKMKTQKTSTKSPRKTHTKHLKADKAKDSPKDAPKKRKIVVTPRKKLSSDSDVKEKNTSDKKVGRSKTKTEPAGKFGPTDDELRQTICEILKEVDFNTATFTDILKRLASRYAMDLTSRKASIKAMIQDELTKLAEEASDEDGDSENGTDAE